jgi:hypothetical protein
VAGVLTDAVHVQGSIANNTVVITWQASSTAAQAIRFTFTYKII